jgi:beta-phosphoglucomutase-like phosphatase (HAD superfamily)
LRAAEHLKETPSSCLALEDSGPGIRAAATAGMRVVWVPDLCRVDSATQELAFAEVASLKHVITLMESLAR